MVYDPEYTTVLYQREPQTLWTVNQTTLQVCYFLLYVVAVSLIVCQNVSCHFVKRLLIALLIG